MSGHVTLQAIVVVALLQVGPVYSAPEIVLSDAVTYNRVGESESLALYFNDDTRSILVRDLRSGTDWTSRVADTEPAFQNANPQWKARMQSLFTFSYFDRSRDTGSRNLGASQSASHTVVVSRLENGVRLDYSFDGLSLALAVEITVDGSQMIFSIPDDSVTETGPNGWVTVEPLPFFGAAPDDAVGYAVLPDGPGALYHFKDIVGSYASEYARIRWHAYSPAEVDLLTYDQYQTEGYRNAYIPAFGIRLGQSAFAALADGGGENSYVTFTQSGQAVDLTRVHPELLYRHQYELFLSAIRAQGNLPAGMTPIKFDADRIPGNRSVRYFFLAGPDATYSGMAAVLRRHYLATGELPEVDLGSEVPLALSVLGGVVEERLLINRYLPMTTFRQAGEMIDFLRENGVGAIRMNLVGWVRGGYGTFPTLWPPERSLGGIAGLSELLAHNADRGVLTYVQANMVDALLENGGFNARTQTVKKGNSLPVTDELRERFLINPRYAEERLEDLISRLQGSGAAGITFERIGDIVYQDCNQQYPHRRRDTIDAWERMVAQSTEQFGGAALQSGFLQLAGKADILFNLPMEASGLIALDEQVPFYQMILHGSIHYGSVPGNLFYDRARQLLQWIEYGSVPHYYLTDQGSELLRDTDVNYLFSSQFSDWSDQAVDAYARFNRELRGFYNLPITEHLRLSETAVRLTFADGSRVYLNYAGHDVVLDGIPVGATDFAVARAPVGGL